MKTVSLTLLLLTALIFQLSGSRQTTRTKLQDIRNGALRAKKKLEKEMEDPNFAKGLPVDVARQIVFDQEAFWDYLSKAEDDYVGTEDEERDARRIVAQMAELEGDLVKPDKMDQVIPLQRRVVDEVRTLMKKEPQSAKYVKEGLQKEQYFPEN